MIPIYKIEIDGTDVTSNFSDRALSIQVSMQDGTESDTARISVDNRDFVIERPRHGVLMRIWLGYMETGLIYCGSYEVDGSSISGPPHTLSVSGRSAGMRTTVKEHRTESYVDMTVGDIVKKIAGRHNLSATLIGNVASIKLPRLDQVLRSDLHILSKLARDTGAMFKIADRQLIFAEEGSSPAPLVQLVETDLIRYQFDIEDRPRHKDVKARWYDSEKGEEITEVAENGPGEATFWIRHLFNSKDEAKKAIDSKMRNLRQAEGTCSVTISGRPEMDAGGKMAIDLAPGTEGPWLITGVDHNYDGGGIQTTLSGKSENGVE